jgi:glutamine synthetase
MFLTIDEAAAFIRAHDVAMIDLKFCDLWGRWRHVTLPTGQFGEALLESGVGFDGSSLGLSAVKSGDLSLVPELGTAFVDPFWEVPTLSFLCATLEADTRKPFPHDPRTVASRAEEFLRSTEVGERSLWGPEFEFYLFDGVSYENGMNVAAGTSSRWASPSSTTTTRSAGPGSARSRPRCCRWCGPPTSLSSRSTWFAWLHGKGG